MKIPLTRPETALLAMAAALLGVALLGPSVAQPPNAHGFADARMLWGVPHAMDVLSNLPFALAGLLGLWRLWRLPAQATSTAQRGMSALFFVGLLLVTFGSSFYHWAPDDAGLAVDRCAMAVAFAGLLGLAGARVSGRAGAVLGLAVLVLGPASVQVWAGTGNVLPWAVVQFGGMALVLGLAALRPCATALPIRWAWVVLAYGAAKLLELNDHAIFEWAGHAVSGHSLKHAIAALAAWPVLAALGSAWPSRQNATGLSPAR